MYHILFKENNIFWETNSCFSRTCCYMFSVYKTVLADKKLIFLFETLKRITIKYNETLTFLLREFFYLFMYLISR